MLPTEVLLIIVYWYNIYVIALETTLLLYKIRKKKMMRRKRLLYMKKYLWSTKIMSEVTISLIKKKTRRQRSQNKMRCKEWWENVVLKTFENSDWEENFRVSRKTFQYICDELRYVLEPLQNQIRDVATYVSHEKKVAISLYYLASCCEYRVVGNQFGVHKSTVHNILHSFVEGINSILTPQHIKMPNEDTVTEVASFFNEISHIPNICGIIDGSHIPILPPQDGYRDYINRKGWPSMVLQGVVDHKYRFTNICIKNPGATHDASVLAGSSLYKHNEHFIPKSTIKLGDHDLPYVIVGDPAYPLLPWLLKGYSNRGLTAEQDSFNVYLNSSRVWVENAFGRLKGRWRTLLKRIDVSHVFAPKVIAACCTLHNIIETRKDNFNPNWMKAVEEAEVTLPQPKNSSNRSFDNLDGHSIREYLCDYISKNYPLRISGRKF